MQIKKGDTVVVQTGKDRTKRARVSRVLPSVGRLIVENVNLANRRERPKKAGQKGQVVKVALPIARANVQLLCPSCNRGVRSGMKFVGAKKVRVCRRCGREI